MSLVAEFFRTTGSEVSLLDLGSEFLTLIGVGLNGSDRAFRIGIAPKKSKAGNDYF